FLLPPVMTSAISVLSLHDALPISETLVYSNGPAATGPLSWRLQLASLRMERRCGFLRLCWGQAKWGRTCGDRPNIDEGTRTVSRSEEHTSELQSRENLVCRLLLEK